MQGLESNLAFPFEADIQPMIKMDAFFAHVVVVRPEVHPAAPFFRSLAAGSSVDMVTVKVDPGAGDVALRRITPALKDAVAHCFFPSAFG